MKNILAILVCFSTATAYAQSAVEIIQKEEQQIFGKTFQAKTKMIVNPEHDARTLEFKVWSQGREKASIKMLKPEKDKNVGNLRLQLQLWQYLPKIDRLIKVPPSMMLQSWMGSDFTNDDLVKSSQLSRDYTLKLLGKVTVNGTKTYQIEATPKPNAPVVWGKVIEYVAQDTYAPVKREMYSEKGKLVKVMVGSEFKTSNNHTMPTKLKMTTLDGSNSGAGRSTEIEYQNILFDAPISENIFSQEFLRKPL
jgi:hypothetical protein